jgi:esterase/lipase
LILHGEKDRICKFSDSKYFFENIKHKVKELYTFKEGLHEVYLDFEKEEFKNKIVTWITKTKNYGKTDKRMNEHN